MALLTRFFERYLGLPASQGGQRTDWRFEFETIPSGWPTALLLLLTVAAGVYLVAIYWRDAAGISLGRRCLLTGLRLAVVLLAGLCLFQLTLSVGRIGLPVIAILIDNSASMGLDDRYPDEKVDGLANQLIHDAGIPAKSRLGLAQAVLTGDEGRFLRQLLKNHTLRLYRFAEGAVRLGLRDFTGPEDLAEMTQKIRELKADGNQTRPGPAVRKVLEDFRGNPPAAIVVFSDGVASTGEADRLSPAAEVAAADFVPLDTVGLGSEQPTRDIQLYDVTAEDLAFVGDPYSVAGKIKADGFSGRTVPVRLTERDSGRLLAQTTVNTGAANAPISFRTFLRADRCRRVGCGDRNSAPARRVEPGEQPRNAAFERTERKNSGASGRFVAALGVPVPENAARARPDREPQERLAGSGRRICLRGQNGTDTFSAEPGRTFWLRRADSGRSQPGTVGNVDDGVDSGFRPRFGGWGVFDCRVELQSAGVSRNSPGGFGSA